MTDQRSIHFGIPDDKLYQEIVNYLEQNKDRFVDRSHMCREALRCLMHFGPDWRTNGEPIKDD